MRHVLAVALAVSLVAPVSSVFAAGAGGAPGTASITGTARAAAKATIRLRNLADGQLAGSTTANAAGQFSFVGLEAGNYVVEVVNAAGAVVASSAPIPVAAGAAVTVGVSAAAAVAAAGGSFFGSTLGIVSVVAAGAAVGGVAVVATRPAASPSR